MPAIQSQRRRLLPLIALLLSAGLAECSLRAALLLDAKYGKPPNCGTRPQILSRLLYAYSGGRYSTLCLDSDAMIYDANRGYKHPPGLHDRMIAGTMTSTNSRGFRGTHEFAVPKPPSQIRIVALGDSLTFGEGVTDSETWPGQLAGDLPGVEVANLGERGFAHDQMYFALQDDGLRLQPDAVIVGFYANDVWRDSLSYYCYEKPKFTQTASGWTIANVPVPTPEQVRSRYLLMPLIYAVPKGIVDFFLEPSIDSRAGNPAATEILTRMKRMAETAGARFMLVNIPENPENPATQGFFQDFCAASGTECVDSAPLFRAAAGSINPAELRKRFLRPNDIHYSREGYAIVADALRKHFVDRPLTR